MKLLLWQSPWFVDSCPVDVVGNWTEGVGVPDDFDRKVKASTGWLPILCSRSSTVWIIRLVVHHQLVIYEVETVRLCLIWMKDHLSNCREKKINCVTRRQIVCISVMFNSITQIAANTQVKTKKKKAQPKNYPNPLFKVLRNPNMLRHHTKYKCSTYPQNSSKEISCGETAVYHCIFHRL